MADKKLIFCVTSPSLAIFDMNNKKKSGKQNFPPTKYEHVLVDLEPPLKLTRSRLPFFALVSYCFRCKCVVQDTIQPYVDWDGLKIVKWGRSLSPHGRIVYRISTNIYIFLPPFVCIRVDQKRYNIPCSSMDLGRAMVKILTWQIPLIRINTINKRLF